MPYVDLPKRGSVAYRWTGAGPDTVVLLNGSVFNYHQWDRHPLPILRRALKGRCRFLQYDYIGVGGSSLRTQPISMLDQSDELRDLLDALGVGRVHLLGISQGSLVGQGFLFQYQDRVKSFCGLGNPSLLSSDWGTTLAVFQHRLDALEQVKSLWPQRVNRRNCVPLFNLVYLPAVFAKEHDELSLPQRVMARIIPRLFYSTAEGTYVQSMVDLLRYYVRDIIHEVLPYAEGLPKVQGVPILLLNGLADTTTPVSMSRELAEILPGAMLVELEGITHMGPMLRRREARPVFAGYAAFLRQVMGEAPGAQPGA